MITVAIARLRGAESVENLGGTSHRMDLTNLSAGELLSNLDSFWVTGNRALAQFLGYLGEVERRRLYEEMACSSMFAFLERRFRLTGGTAYRRLTAARLVRRFPAILSRVESGDIHLDGLCALKDVLTASNVEELMVATARKTLREVEHIVACRMPKPDVEASIRKVPERQPTTPLTSAESRTLPLFSAAAAPAPQAEVVIEPAAAAPPPSEEPSRIDQLSEKRHKLRVTVSTEIRRKIVRASNLMKHRSPTSDLETLLESALDALLEKLEKERLGKTSRPQAKPRPSQPGHVAQATRREVFERDGERCTFEAPDGTRCEERGMLELDHIEARALGGTDDASNLRVRCRTHNQMYARQVFGEAHVARMIGRRQRVQSPGS